MLAAPDGLRMTYILHGIAKGDMNPVEAMELLTTRMGRTKSNVEFLKTLNLA